MSCLSYTIDRFLSFSHKEVLSDLLYLHKSNHSNLSTNQTIAWEREIEEMKILLKDRKGRIIFEYNIPELSKVVDIILLIEGKIFVIEYKVNSKTYNEQDVHQVNGYALRLKYFHSKSNDNWIVPVLVSTDAESEPLINLRSEEDKVYSVIKCNSTNLSIAIDTILKESSAIYDEEWENTWEKGVYKASPTIIEAARNVWRKNNVLGFSIADAVAETRLEAEDYIVNVATEAMENKKKAICFVTGVPGAGKTLVGLNLSVRLQDYGASMLSGNGPLVAVLTAALKEDMKKYTKKLNKPKNEVAVETIIRGAYGYKKEIFEKRLEYKVGTGEVCLKKDAEVGNQHIIIFDEAQRAWNKKQMITPGQQGRKYWQEECFPFSEPGLLLWDMNQMDWGVFVCLVGGGQEINDGEAGICEWLKAIKSNPDLSDWHIYMSDDLIGEEYDTKVNDGDIEDDCKTLEDYRNYFKERNSLTVNPALHLNTSQRSNRSNKVSMFVHELLECNEQKAKELHDQFKDKYHIYLTRDLETAKQKLLKRKSLLLDKGYVDGINDDDIRIGLLMSSKAARLRPLGLEIKKVSEYLSKVHNWFLKSSSHVESSNFMEVALNEFFVQGLELDLCAVVWDADLRYDEKCHNWDYYCFNNGIDWSVVDKKNIIKRFYMKNAYRVLLTRARAGLIIVIPKGSVGDQSRNPAYYDCTYNFLKRIGIKEIQ